MTGEEARYVLEEDRGRSVSLHKGKEGEGEAGAGGGAVGVVETSPFAGDGEIGAGEAAGPEGGVLPGTRFAFQPCGIPLLGRTLNATAIAFLRPTRSDGLTSLDGPSLLSVEGKSHDVPEVRDSRPSLGEDGAGVRVNFGEADGLPSDSFEPHIESADS